MNRPSSSTPDDRLGDRQRSLVDVAQDYIRERITSGEIPPGERLKERDLAEETGISRIPIREALRGLASEGFITLQPRRGAVVTQLVPADLDEIFEVREALEVQESVLAARNALPDEIKRMQACVLAAEQAVAADDKSGVNAANTAFHDVLVEMSHNALLSTMLEPLQSRLRWLLRQNDEVGAICSEHADIADAIAAHDIDRARELAIRHVQTSKRVALHLLFGSDQHQTQPAPDNP